jgi:hypothetical protein
VRFEVLTAATLKATSFCVVAPCRLLEPYRRFIDTTCLCYQGDGFVFAMMMEAAGTSETSVNFFMSALRQNSEDSPLHRIYYQRSGLSQ